MPSFAMFSFLGRLLLYFRERFPLPLVALLSAGFGTLVIGIVADDLPLLSKLEYALIAAAMFTMLLLRQRVTDEFKDLRHDNSKYPNRPFQRGTILKKELIIMGIAALALELFFVYLIGGRTSLVWYVPVLLYTVLMAFEFGIGRWLARHFTIYFLLHEAVFLLIGLWLIGSFGTGIDITVVVGIIALALILSAVEIIRKFELRYDPKGEVVADTYPAVWGRSHTVTVLHVIVIISGILLAYSQNTIVPSLVAVFFSVLLGVVGKKDIWVKIAVAGYFIAQAFGVILW